MSLPDAAEFLTAQWPVFPCGANKRPVVERGFYAATRDPVEARALFLRPGAALIGVPTGSISDLVVLDFDIKRDANGLAWLRENEHRLPRTRRHRTRSGGEHLLFRHPGVTIRNSAGVLSPGVDVRGDGGYIIVPPSEGYEILDAAMPAEMPVWLVAQLLAKREPEPTPVVNYEVRPLTYSDGSAWGLGALRRACDAIRSAADGTKHATLNREAYSIGGLVTGGDLVEGVARAALADALAAIRHRCDDFKAAERTLADAFRAGMDKPRQPPAPLPPMPPQRMPFGIGEAVTEDGHTYDPETGEILAAPAATAAKQHRLPVALLSIADIEAMPPPEWLIDGLLPAQGLIVPYGPPKVGKTFIVLSMGLHVAAGKDWFGRPVRQGVVIYIAGEGLGGLALRIKAMRLEYGIPADAPFYVRPKAVNFRDAQAVAELVAMARETAAGRPIAMIVIDTLARAMPGVDENSAQEVGIVIAACDMVKEELRCAVAPIHHTGKDQERGMRGSNAIHGAVDTTLRIKAAGERRVQMINEDQKDGEPAPPMTFEMKEVSTGFRSSLVPVPEEARPLGRPPGDAPDAQELLTRVVLAMNGVSEAPLGRLAEAVFGLRNGRNSKTLCDVLPASPEHAAVVRLGEKTVRLWRRIAGEHKTAPIYVVQEEEDAE